MKTLIVIFALLFLLWQWLHSHPTSPDPPPAKTVTVQSIDWDAINAETRVALMAAHHAAEAFAEKEVTRWVADKKRRLETVFLPWLFDYWTQQTLTLKTLEYQCKTACRIQTDPQPETMLETAFQCQILQPVLSQQQIERISRDMVALYMEHLKNGLAQIQRTYRIPITDWEPYMKQSARLIRQSIQPDQSIDLGTKAATTAALVAGIRWNVPTTLLRNTAIKLLPARSLAWPAARLGLRSFGFFVGGGVIAWEWIEHRHNREQNEPLLLEQFNQYLDELQQDLLHDPEIGLLQILDQLDEQHINPKGTSHELHRTQ